MENILIICLKRFGDILSTGHLINSIQKCKTNCKISILVFKEFEKAAKCLKGVSKIYCIDRKQVTFLKKCKMFHPSVALNEFHSQLYPLMQTSWDNIINFSNTLMGSYLISFLGPKMHTGIGIDKNGLIQGSDNWSLIFNEIMPVFPFTPIHFLDCFHQMLAIEWKEEEIKVHTLDQNNQKAQHNFSILRKNLESKGSPRKIVGIQLKSSSKSKDIAIEVIIDLIKMLINDENFYPVLLVSPHDEEKELADGVNGHFNNMLLSIEADFIALPSVLMNLDLLVTPDTSVKHMADLVGLPIVEVSLGNSPFLKQGTVNANNIVISPVANYLRMRESSMVGTNPELNCPISAKDIYQGIYKIFNLKKTQDLELSPAITMYISQRDDQGIWYKPIAGEINVSAEISVHMSRTLIHAMLNGKYEHSTFEFITNNFSKSEVFSWIDAQKDQINMLVKVLLRNLKILRGIGPENQQGKEFVKCLDELLSFCEDQSMISLPCLLFKSALENICSKSMKENVKEIEQKLFRLKDHIQILTRVIGKLSSGLAQERQETITARA